MATRDGDPPNEIELDVGDSTPRPDYQNRHLLVQELVRAGLAIAFYLLLALTIIWTLVLVNGGGWTNAKEALQILLPVETALVGASTAFYYRSRED